VTSETTLPRNGDGGPPRVALIVDHPLRDLAGLVLVAQELCRRGAVCHLVPLNLQEGEIWSLQPDIVLLNYFRRNNEGFARRLRATGIGYCLLDTEGGVWDDVRTYTDLLWSDPTLLRDSTAACIWGSHLADVLIREGRFRTEGVSVTGCPRFDFYAPQWRAVLNHQFSVMELTGRPQVLINTLYGTVNSRLFSKEANADRLERVLGWPKSRVDNLVTKESAAIEAVLAMAGKLSRDFPQVDFVLRPHPFESPDLYRKRLVDFGNVYVDGEGPVQGRILTATAVIQRSCTTAVESVMAGVPTLSPQFVPAPSLNPMVEAVSDPCDSYADLAARLTSILDGRYAQPPARRAEISRVVHEWFHVPDGNAYLRVAEALSSRWGRRSAVDRGLCKRYLYGFDSRRRGLGERVARQIRYAGGLSPSWSFSKLKVVPPKQSDVKEFGSEDASTLLQRIQTAEKAAGGNPQAIRVETALERGDYRHGFIGQAVTMSRG